MHQAVLIIGAGPVGLTMAAELARYGVPVRIIDKSSQRTDKSKALVIWSRTLELIDRMGCGASFADAGLKVKAANIIAGGRPVAHVRLDALPTPHPYALMLAQSETERLMEEHLDSLGVQVERRTELLRFTPGAELVAATLRRADGREESLEARWLIGCDGAHSAVRHGLGMPFEGETLPSDWILADIRLTGLGDKACEVNTFWHSDGVLAVFPITSERCRIIADVGDGATGAPAPDPTLADVQTILDRRGPGGLAASDPAWLAAFRINERKVADYRGGGGRVFLAGDAAHIHSPAGGQGMNTGMQDAFNLAWKLALVHRGAAAPEPLLASYSPERSAVGRQVLADAGRLTALAIMRGGIAQSIRNHIASLVFGLAPVRGLMAGKLAELSIGYPHGPLTFHAHHGDARAPAPGERAPISAGDAPFGAGQTPRFALFAQSDAHAAAFIARHGDLLEPAPRDPFAAHGLWLVRPDGYIALAAKHDDWALAEECLQRITGGRPAQPPNPPA